VVAPAEGGPSSLHPDTISTRPRTGTSAGARTGDGTRTMNNLPLPMMNRGGNEIAPGMTSSNRFAQ
jgi:hypothetical protein